MKLTRIDAIRYGALEDACLDGLGDGLTIVLGPNESGKTTFTTLARHVLYGYPDGRTTELGYTPSAGAREARLTFASEEGEWTISRVDGPRGGTIVVRALKGAERPGLASEIVGGVTKESFQVVFAFGLDELAKIDRGGPGDIVGRLHAAGFGLEVNPFDVQRSLEKRASQLYTPRATKPVVNALAAQARAVSARVRELEAQGTQLASEQARMGEFAERAAAFKSEHDELDSTARRLERDAQRAADAADQLRGSLGELAELDARISDAAAGLALIDVDQRVLAAAPNLSSVLGELPVFLERLERVSVSEAAGDEARRTASVGVTLPTSAHDSVENRAAVESWRTSLLRLDAEAESALRAAEQAEARLAGSEAMTLASGPGRERPIASIVVALLAAIVGVILVAFGLFAGQFAPALAGGAVSAAAVASLVIVLSRRPSPSTLGAEIAVQRADAATARALATAARDRSEAARDEWRQWLAASELDSFGDDPVAVIGMLEALKQRESALADAERHLAAARRERQAAEDWVVRLVDVAGRFDASGGQIPALQAAPELAARAKAALDRAQSSEAERLELQRELAGLRSEQARAASAVETQRRALLELGAAHGVDATDPVPELASLAASATESLASVRLQLDDTTASYNELRGRLNEEARDDEMTRARQQLEGVRARAAVAADSYLVDAVAVHLLDRARERFEADRQPEVVRTAARVFSAMTDGQYVDVRMPLDGSEIVVVGKNGVAKTATELSRGTAEQLYLALRVGLIGSLGELGRWLPVLMDDVIVNFDDDRRIWAATAVREIAASRQVLFFTCHPEIADLLARRVDGAQLVKLPRCELRG